MQPSPPGVETTVPDSRDSRRSAFEAMRALCVMARAAEEIVWTTRPHEPPQETVTNDSNHPQDIAKDDVYDTTYHEADERALDTVAAEHWHMCGDPPLDPR